MKVWLLLLFTCIPSFVFCGWEKPFAHLFSRPEAVLEARNEMAREISLRKAELSSLKERFAPKIAHLQQAESEFYADLETLLAQGFHLTLIAEGQGATYLLSDAQKQPKFIVKPLDEQQFCLNHPKKAPSPYHGTRFLVRRSIPLYEAAQTESLAYFFSKAIDLQAFIPPTCLYILESEEFWDFSDALDPDEQTACHQLFGLPDRQKLCSVQRYVPDTITLYQAMVDYLDHNKPLPKTTLEHFEKLLLLLWLLYDTDAHAGNLQLVSHGTSWQWMKFDNELTFPYKNEHFEHALSFLPEARAPLSSALKKCIEQIDPEMLQSWFLFFEKQNAFPAFLQRLNILKFLALRDESISLLEIDVRLRALQLPDGAELALSHYDLDTLVRLLAPISP